MRSLQRYDLLHSHKHSHTVKAPKAFILFKWLFCSFVVFTWYISCSLGHFCVDEIIWNRCTIPHRMITVSAVSGKCISTCPLLVESVRNLLTRFRYDKLYHLLCEWNVIRPWFIFGHFHPPVAWDDRVCFSLSASRAWIVYALKNKSRSEKRKGNKKRGAIQK